MIMFPDTPKKCISMVLNVHMCAHGMEMISLLCIAVSFYANMMISWDIDLVIWLFWYAYVLVIKSCFYESSNIWIMLNVYLILIYKYGNELWTVFSLKELLLKLFLLLNIPLSEFLSSVFHFYFSYQIVVEFRSKFVVNNR